MIADVQTVLDFQVPAWADEGAPARVEERVREHHADLAALMTQVLEGLAEDPDLATRRAREVIHDAMRSADQDDGTS